MNPTCMQTKNNRIVMRSTCLVSGTTKTRFMSRKEIEGAGLGGIITSIPLRVTVFSKYAWSISLVDNAGKNTFMLFLRDNVNPNKDPKRRKSNITIIMVLLVPDQFLTFSTISSTRLHRREEDTTEHKIFDYHCLHAIPSQRDRCFLDLCSTKRNF